MDTIPAAARAMIGQEAVEYFLVTDRDIRRFAQAIGDPNPIYSDETVANNSPYKGIIAPPLICQMFAYTDCPAGELKQDGSPKEIDVPLPTDKVLGGSSAFELGEPIRIGDEIKVTKKIIDIHRKSGRSGELYFVVVENRWENQHGQLVAREVASYINR
ncbi:MAG: MaoC family dehydratase N-terminal domain-containing protein [Gammaproteobacteria bacterium]|nr:MaoC family dehydratase N-terminal domain-containing protein [Gammaproteobacteria bacterium]